MTSRNYEDNHYTILSIFRHIYKATAKRSYQVCHVSVCLHWMTQVSVGRFSRTFIHSFYSLSYNRSTDSSKASYIAIFTKTCQLQLRLVKIKKYHFIRTNTYICILPIQKPSEAKETGNDLNTRIYNISSQVKNRNVIAHSTYNEGSLFSVTECSLKHDL